MLGLRKNSLVKLDAMCSIIIITLAVVLYLIICEVSSNVMDVLIVCLVLIYRHGRLIIRLFQSRLD